MVALAQNLQLVVQETLIDPVCVDVALLHHFDGVPFVVGLCRLLCLFCDGRAIGLTPLVENFRAKSDDSECPVTQQLCSIVTNLIVVIHVVDLFEIVDVPFPRRLGSAPLGILFVYTKYFPVALVILRSIQYVYILIIHFVDDHGVIASSALILVDSVPLELVVLSELILCLFVSLLAAQVCIVACQVIVSATISTH